MWKAAILSALLLAACAPQQSGPTAAQKEARDIGVALDSTLRRARECIGTVKQGAEYEALTGKFTLDQPSMEMLADRRRPTPAETALLLAVHRRLSACRAQNLQALEGVNAAFVSVAASSYAEADIDLAKLVRRDISWGEYSQLSVARFERGRERYTQAAERIKAGLDKSHDREILERQTAARALSDWTQAQRASFPVTTTCVYTGPILSCQSY